MSLSPPVQLSKRKELPSANEHTPLKNPYMCCLFTPDSDKAISSIADHMGPYINFKEGKHQNFRMPATPQSQSPSTGMTPKKFCSALGFSAESRVDAYVSQLRRDEPQLLEGVCTAMLANTLQLPSDTLAKLLSPKCCASNTNKPAIDEANVSSIIELLSRVIEDKYHDTEGIFRIPGNKTRSIRLEKQLLERDVMDFAKRRYSPHDVATVLKKALSGFGGIIPERTYQTHLLVAGLTYDLDKATSAASENQDQPMRNNLVYELEMRKLQHIKALRLLLLLCSPEEAHILHTVLRVLHSIAGSRDKSKMSSESLALIFTPHIFWSKKLKQEELLQDLDRCTYAVTFMIDNCHKIFQQHPVDLLVRTRKFLRRSNQSELDDVLFSAETETPTRTTCSPVPKRRLSRRMSGVGRLVPKRSPTINQGSPRKSQLNTRSMRQTTLDSVILRRRSRHSGLVGSSIRRKMSHAAQFLGGITTYSDATSDFEHTDNRFGELLAFRTNSQLSLLK